MMDALGKLVSNITDVLDFNQVEQIAKDVLTYCLIGNTKRMY